jgi:hypothetical protein
MLELTPEEAAKKYSEAWPALNNARAEASARGDKKTAKQFRQKLSRLSEECAARFDLETSFGINNTYPSEEPLDDTDEGQAMHWFCLYYFGKSKESGLNTTACAYVQCLRKKIPMSVISMGMATAKVSEDSILISASYLGKMTRKEFLGE